MKRLIMTMMVLLGLVTAQAWAAEQSPEELVKQTSDRMLNKLREEKQVIKDNPERIYELVNQIVLPHFDFEYMSQLVVGKYWRRATPQQRQDFTEQFKQLLVRTYATSLNEYTDQKLNFLPFRQGSDPDQAEVDTEVEQPGGFPIPIDYKLHRNSNEWKVFDVVIDDVSLVTNYRTSFAQEIREKGLDGLIETLKKRNEEVMNK
jgi:phospholipid transport system substrate-binding protein